MGERRAARARTTAAKSEPDLVALALALAEHAHAEVVVLRALAALESSAGSCLWAILDRRDRASYHAVASDGIGAEALDRLAPRAAGADASLIFETSERTRSNLPKPSFATASAPRSSGGSRPDVVVAAWPKPGRTPPSRTALQRAARLVAGAVATAHAMGILVEQSTHDPLTGALNRRGILEVLRREVSAARRHARALSVIYLDIDRFKAVNDHYGHPVGDVVLAGFAGRLRLLLRASDSVGRIGGDEFVVILPDSNLAAAKRLSRRLSRDLFAVPLPTPAGSLVLRATLGAAALTAQETAEHLLESADRVLLRNRRRRRTSGGPASVEGSGPIPTYAARPT